MRLTHLLICSLLIGAIVSAASAAEPRKKKAMKAGPEIDLLEKGLDGWDFFVIEPDVERDAVWSIEDGVLKTTGEPLGYLSTKEKFDHLRLSLEWRWAPDTKPGNSGVLLRIDGEPISFLPKCVEAQLMHERAGDIWGFYGFKLSGDPERFREIKGHEALGDFIGVGRTENHEKEPGEWNTYDIRLVGGRMMVRVNGEQVNAATDVEVVNGPIGLQSEGGEIHFRNLRVRRLSVD
jgi:hypothetical protein